MVNMKVLLSFPSLVAVVSATTGILQPIYIFPETADWQATYAAREAHRNLPWQVIVNPNSGPCCFTEPNMPCSPTPGCPAQNWPTTISHLNSLNVTTLGYVNVARTDTTIKSEAEVQSEIDLFARWNNVDNPSTPGAKLVLNGIFFDDSGFSEAQLEQQRKYVTYAFSAHPNFRTFALNLGQMPDTNQYFDIIPNANIEVVIWETCWVNPGDPPSSPPPDCPAGMYTPFSLAELDRRLQSHPLDATQRAKSAVLVHGVRDPHDPSLSAAVLRSELQGLVDRGIGWTAWASQGWATSNSFTTSPVSIGEVADDLASIQGLPPTASKA